MVQNILQYQYICLCYHEYLAEKMPIPQKNLSLIFMLEQNKEIQVAGMRILNDNRV